MTPFRQLTYLVAVADHGSILAASRQLSISQPAISAAIQKVEDQYQLKIFIRERPHRLVVSPVGRRFVALARRFLEHAQEFDNDARNLRHSPRGVIQVGCFMPTAAFIIPIILKGLRDRGFDISLQVHEADLDELNTLLAQGRIDLALTYNMAPSPAIEFETLIESTPYVLIPRDDKLAQLSSISLDQLVDRDMVSLSLPITQQFFLSLFAQRNLRPRIRHQTKSYELVRSLVGAGEGYAILIMRPANVRAYDGSELAYVPLDGDIPHSHYGLAFTNQSIPTRLVEIFADLCRELLVIEKKADKYLVSPCHSGRKGPGLIGQPSSTPP